MAAVFEDSKGEVGKALHYMEMHCPPPLLARLILKVESLQHITAVANALARSDAGCVDQHCHNLHLGLLVM